MSKHTPTPWRVENDLNIIGGNGRYVAPCGYNQNFGDPLTESKANAKLIVRAVNAHEALVEALQRIGGYDRSGKSFTVAYYELRDIARAALELAQKGTK